MTGSFDGEPLSLPAGAYRVRVEGRKEEIPVKVVADDAVVVDSGKLAH